LTFFYFPYWNRSFYAIVSSIFLCVIGIQCFSSIPPQCSYSVIMLLFLFIFWLPPYFPSAILYRLFILPAPFPIIPCFYAIFALIPHTISLASILFPLFELCFYAISPHSHTPTPSQSFSARHNPISAPLFYAITLIMPSTIPLPFLPPILFSSMILPVFALFILPFLLCFSILYSLCHSRYCPVPILFILFPQHHTPYFLCHILIFSLAYCLYCYCFSILGSC
jgi:hypothetical protein